MSGLDKAAVVALVGVAADATKAVLAADQDSPSPAALAERLIGVGLNLVPVAELRKYLDAAEAAAIDESVDIAEEAKLAALKIGAVK